MANFVPIKRCAVDNRGRFYLPESVCQQMFARDAPRVVQVYLSDDGRLLLEPLRSGPRRPQR